MLLPLSVCAPPSVSVCAPPSVSMCAPPSVSVCAPPPPSVSMCTPPTAPPTPQEERRRAEVEENKLRSIREEERVKVGESQPLPFWYGDCT